MTADTYAGLPVRRNLFQCDDWQWMAENLLAFQDAVQDEVRSEEAKDMMPMLRRLKADHEALEAVRALYVKAMERRTRTGLGYSGDWLVRRLGEVLDGGGSDG